MAQIITDPIFYAFAIPAVVFLGLAKGGFSALTMAATPLLALYLPPLEAAALLLPIVLCQDAISVYVYRREWSVWNLQVLLPGAAAGIVLGWLLAVHVSDNAIRLLIGGTSLAFVVSAWLHPGRGEEHEHSALKGLLFGAMSGFASFASQGGGPPFQMFTLPQRMPKMVLVGTTTLFFAAVNMMKVMPYFMLAQFSSRNFGTSVTLLPLAVAANFAGIWIVRVMPMRLFYEISYILLAVLGAALLWQGGARLLI